MSEENTSTTLWIADEDWAWVGKLAAAVTLVWAAIVAGDAFLWGEGEADLEGTLRSHNFEWPPGLIYNLGGMCAGLESFERGAFLRGLRVEASKRKAIQKEIGRILQETCDGFTPRTAQRWGRVSTLYVGEIRNKGGAVAESVTLIVPNNIVAGFYRQGGSPELMEDESRLNLGTLRPDEAVAVRAWSSSQYGHGIGSEGIRLIHSGGEEEVEVLGPTTPFLQMVYERYGGASVGQVTIFLFFGGVLILVLMKGYQIAYGE